MGLPASSNITSYWSDRRACDPLSASSALAAANPDTEPDSPVEADSPLEAPRRIQTGQNSLSAVAKNFVPQTGQVRASCCTDPGPVLGSSAGFLDSAFTALALLHWRFAHDFLPQSWKLDPCHLPLSCRSLSSGTHFELNTNGTAQIFHYFRLRSDFHPKSMARKFYGAG